MIDGSLRTSSAAHVWDFFKPNPHSEYPEVDGALSQSCYLQSLDDCYTRYAAKQERKADKVEEAKAAKAEANASNHAASGGRAVGAGSAGTNKSSSTSPGFLSSAVETDSANSPTFTTSPGGDSVFTVADSDYFVFHSPYNKLVQKSFARLLLTDARRHGSVVPPGHIAALLPWLSLPLKDTCEDKSLEKTLKNLAAEDYSVKVAPSCGLSKQIGNTYTAAVFMNLTSLVDELGERLRGKKVTVFSYGSGSIASMYEIRGRVPTGPLNKRFTLERIQATVQLQRRLASRADLPPIELSLALEARALAHGLSGTKPQVNCAQCSRNQTASPNPK